MKIVKRFISFALILACTGAGIVSATEIPANPVWPRPVILPMPDASLKRGVRVESTEGLMHINNQWNYRNPAHEVPNRQAQAFPLIAASSPSKAALN